MTIPEPEALAPAEEREGSTKGFPVLPVAVAMAAGILLFGYSFSPDLVNLLEFLAGQAAPMEVWLRAHFLVVTSQVVLVLIALLYVFPVRNPKRRILLYFLLAEAVILCSIWIFDKSDIPFYWEKSALTFFSANVLILCSLTAILNGVFLPFRTGSETRSKWFWYTLAAAFLFAGIDEFFMVHEKVSRWILDINWFNDLITGLYAVGAVLYIGVFYKVFKEETLREDGFFLKTFCAGIASFSIAMLFDSFDFLFQRFDRHVDTIYLLNSLEELMEFTAATLFLCALTVKICQIRGRTLGLTMTRVAPFVPSRLLRRSYIGMVLLSALGALAITMFFGVGEEPVIFEEGYEVSVFADLADGFRDPDVLLFDPELGLIVGDDIGSKVFAFDPEGNGRVLADETSGLKSPEGVAVWKESLLVSDDSKKNGGKVFRYDLGEAKPMVFAQEGLRSPEGLAVDSDGDLYLVDEALSLVIKYADGERQIVASSLDGLMTPEELAFDDRGNIYVTDEKVQAVFKITPGGKVTVLADRSDGLVLPEGIAVNRGHIYVTDNETGKIFRFEPDGSGGEYISFSRRHRELSGIAFDDRNRLYVVASDPYSKNRHIFRIVPRS